MKKYNKVEIFSNLEEWDNALRNSDILTFRFGTDDQHDSSLIEWFSKNGEMRIYRENNYYHVWLKTFNGLAINLGILLPFGIEYSKNIELKKIYIKKAWILIKDKGFKFCTNNLLKTPEEVNKDFGGDIQYTFSNSKESNKSIIKHSAKAYNILNSL